jgi:hypothetical protein
VSRRFKVMSQIGVISVGGVAAPLSRFHKVLLCHTYGAQIMVMRHHVEVPSFTVILVMLVSIDRSSGGG